jgi:rfaE bifunctional protein kinase chain/domain
MLTSELIEHVLATIPNRTVGVLGDLFLDRYLDIDPSLNEPSVETGLTAYQVTRVRAYPGAAGTVVNNLYALGVGRIVPVTSIGDDGEGYELRQALRALPCVDQSAIITDVSRRTPTYTKPMLGNEELNRLDIKNRARTPNPVQARVVELLRELWPTFDALLVLDQVSEEDCGVVTASVRAAVSELAAREPSKFVLADSRERIGLFRNVCVKPNERELHQMWLAAGAKSGLSPDRRLAEGVFGSRVGRAVFLTLGALGIKLLEPGHGERLVPAYPVSGPIDVCGAGDSCSAGIACAKVSGATHEQAAAFGNLIASITVQQLGVTGTAPPDAVRARWREVRA